MNQAATHGEEVLAHVAGGAMLYDASLPGHADEDWFDPDRWHGPVSVERQAGGRGTVAFLRDDARRWVLRHYRRGGAVARVLDDRYLYTGADRTRGFREWRLLRASDSRAGCKFPAAKARSDLFGERRPQCR